MPTASKMVSLIVFIFLLAILGAAFTPVLQTQVDSWSSNLTTEGQTAAAAVVDIIPLLFWILLAVAIILGVVATLMPGRAGL